ncbi:serine/threonine-protein kinase [Verrucomicrobiales bacterium BCK34]|nr:serine/threonine-protein kinase [Verrucomicrobiales bacterium BCK34]
MEKPLCPSCGFPLSEGVTGGLCPRCILGSIGGTGTPRSQEQYFLADGKAKVTRAPSSAQFLTIGPYHLIEPLGKGGMGEVWAARQEYPVERNVGLKIMRTGSVDPGVIERFRAESRTLAVMNHPNIVQLYEVGETESGEPYFAMEIISGEPIVKFCNSRKLSIRTRLSLMLKVTRAVEHSHRHGIIHRDLKPDNILVSVDREGNFVPKLIDFGIAKTLEEKWPDNTLLTLDGQILGTPQYMSPEQADGGEVETRSDVFGLGTVLYELLTGDPPLAASTIAEQNIESLLKMIREREAERPSIRVQTASGENREAEAANRNTTFDRWPKQLRDELDWIALRCIEKSPSRRYDSAGALADDLNRYLDGDPVSARPPSRRYRARKFVRKHKTLVFSALSIFCILLLATWLSVRWAIEATDAKELADARLAEADAVPEFLLEAFRQAAPENGGSDMLALDVLRQAETTVTFEFFSQPAIRARIQEAIGRTYSDLGRSDLASAIFENALESAEEVPDNGNMVQRLTHLLNGANRASGRQEKALIVSRESWKNLSASLGENHEDVHVARMNHCRNLLEAAYWNDEKRSAYLDEVRKTLNEVLKNPDRFPGFNERAYLAIMAQHATGSGNHEAAYEFWNREIDRHHLEGRSRQKGHYWPSSFLVASLRRTDRLEEAMAAAESLLLHCRDFYGPYHSHTTDSSRYLADVFGDRESPAVGAMICRLTALDLESIDPLFRENVGKLLRWSGKLELSTEDEKAVQDIIASVTNTGDHDALPNLQQRDPGAAFWLGEHLCNTQHQEIGLALLEQAYHGSIEEFGASHPVALIRGNRYAQRCIKAGKLETASGILTPQLTDKELTWRNGPVLDIVLDLAEALMSGGNDEAAGLTAKSVIRIQIENKGTDEERVSRSIQILSTLAGKHRDFQSLAQIFENLYDSFSQTRGENHKATLYYRIRQVDCLIDAQKHGEALTMISDFLKDKAPDDPQFAPWRISKAKVSMRLGQFGEAEHTLLADWELFQSKNISERVHPKHVGRMRFRLSNTLSTLYLKWGKPEKMENWKEISASLIAKADQGAAP